MKFDSPKNPNYAATVVALKDFVYLTGCDNIQGALIFNNQVIVAVDAKPGDLGLYFPAETALSAEFLAANNLYRKPEWGNVDPAAKGFFEQHGRVKTVKFRGHKSEGFWIPLESLWYTGVLKEQKSPFSPEVGDTFDKIGDHEICRKYVSARNPGKSAPEQGRQARLEDNIVDGQFRFHFDTENLRRNVHKINPTDYISISDKWHGTSVVIAKLLVNRKLSFVEKALQFFGVAIDTKTYGMVNSSRRVIKAVNGVTKEANHYYTEDIWGVVAQEVESKTPAGFTVYGEIVGFSTDGQPIQGGYAYGCVDKQHRFVAYRVTLTTQQGIVVELTWPQMTEFLAKYGIERVPELYYGQAGDLYPRIPRDDKWNDNFLYQLEADYVRDGDCKYNVKGTPAEGIVLRVDSLNQCESYKLKNFRFLEAESKQLDKGVLDTETAESEELPAAA